MRCDGMTPSAAGDDIDEIVVAGPGRPMSSVSAAWSEFASLIPTTPGISASSRMRSAGMLTTERDGMLWGSPARRPGLPDVTMIPARGGLL